MHGSRVQQPWPGYAVLDDRYVNVTGDTMTGDLIMENEVKVIFGSTQSMVGWDNTDPNAGMLKIDLPTGDATDVPVLAIGNGIIGEDLALLDGQLEPAFAIFKADRTEHGYFAWKKYGALNYFTMTSSEMLRLEASGDQIAFINGGPTTGGAWNLRAIFRTTKNGGQCGFELGEPNSSLFYMRYDGTFDQAGWYVSSFCGRQGVLADANQRDRDQDIVPQDDPVFVVKRNFNPNTDNAYHSALNFKGLRCGELNNADFESSSWSMETDSETWDFVCGAASAYQNASAITNPDGGSWITLAGNANLLDTTSGDGGDVKESPGEGNSNGRHGRYHIQRQGMAKFDGSYTYQEEVATTDATVTTTQIIPTTNNTIIHLEARVSTIEDDGSNAASYIRVGTFKNDGGVLAQVGATTNSHTAEDVAGWDCTLDTNGTDIRVRVTGAAATNLQWSSDVKVLITNA